MPALPQLEDVEALSRGASRTRSLLAAMVLIATVAPLAGIFVLYRASLSRTEQRLGDLVRRQAELTNAVLRVDPVHGPERATSARPGERAVRTNGLPQLVHASDVELMILLRREEKVLVLVGRGASLDPASGRLPKEFPLGLAERALRQNGTAEYPSDDGRTWLAVYQRLARIDGAVLARVDIGDMRRPFWLALAVSGLGCVLTIGLGVLLARRSNLALVDELARALARRVAAEAELQSHWDHLERTIEQRTLELRQAQNELILRERLATLGQITAKVSHELRNPLATLQASLFTLRERTKEQTVGLERILDRADRNVARCNRIIEELLSYTRPRTPRRDTFSLSELLEEVLSEYQPVAPVALKREIEPGIRLLADREDVRRMVINLLNNAVDATSERGPTDASVRLVLERDPSQIVVRIEDTGVGMPSEVLAKAFEPLFSTKGFGIGLGLPIIRELADRNGARVALTSRPGEGTRAELKFSTAGVNP